MTAERTQVQIIGIAVAVERLEDTQRILYLAVHVSNLVMAKIRKMVAIAWDRWKGIKEHARHLQRQLIVKFSMKFAKSRTTRLAMSFAELRAHSKFVKWREQDHERHRLTGGAHGHGHGHGAGSGGRVTVAKMHERQRLESGGSSSSHGRGVRS